MSLTKLGARRVDSESIQPNTVVTKIHDVGVETPTYDKYGSEQSMYDGNWTLKTK